MVDKKEGWFVGTVFKVEMADIAFAVDSILAAVALAMTLPIQTYQISAVWMVESFLLSLLVD